MTTPLPPGGGPGKSLPELLTRPLADNAELLAKGQDASFQNKVLLAMQAKGFFVFKEPEGSDE